MDDTLRYILIAAGTVGVFVGGFMSGSMFAHNKLETQLDERLEEAIEAETKKIKAHYAAVHKTEFPTPGDLPSVKEVKEIVETYTGQGSPLLQRGPQPGLEYLNIKPKPAVDEEPEPEIITRTVFNNMVIESDSWDPDTTEPHVISIEDFSQNDNGWEQETLTWYAGDNTLADARDEPVSDMRLTIGEGSNLELFGFISKDKNVVHIRNPHLETDFEILRSDGTYAREVAGFMGED